MGRLNTNEDQAGRTRQLAICLRQFTDDATFDGFVYQSICDEDLNCICSLAVVNLGILEVMEIISVKFVQRYPVDARYYSAAAMLWWCYSLLSLSTMVEKDQPILSVVTADVDFTAFLHVVAFTTVLWEEWHTLWVLRNADVHGKDEATRALAEMREVTQQKLASIYDQRNHMEPSAQALLFPDIRTHLQQPSWVIQTWLTIRGPTFIQSLRKNVKRKAIQNVRSIREYYAPAQG